MFMHAIHTRWLPRLLFKFLLNMNRKKFIVEKETIAYVFITNSKKIRPII